uniref:Carn_acyltransf domain-containing protein n=1 Tax=Toxocara canis TaxID=6265 RepID=A0A183VFG2_TOXCA
LPLTSHTREMGEPETALQQGSSRSLSHPVRQFYEVVQGGYKCPRCGGREQVGLNTTNTMKHLKARHETEYAELVEALSHRKQPLEQWWYDAYNEIRSPLAPFLSLASVNQRFAPAEGTQLCRAAEFLHHAVRYWLSIRRRLSGGLYDFFKRLREQIPITKSRGTVWDMHQYYNMFNAARIPARPKDVIRRFFCTEKEGASSSEVLVLCRGNIWIIETMPNNEVLSPDIFLHQLTFIDHQSKRCRSSPIPLTTLQRDKWADVISYGLVGCADAQWVDKSMNFFFHKDGRMGTQAEVSNHCYFAV